MLYMLDTKICIYIMKQKPISVFKKFESLTIGTVGMSLVTYGELQFGALRSNNARKALDILDELAAYIPVQSMPTAVAAEYAEIRADLSAKGMLIGNNDLWIAAHARALDLTLVTNNAKEFGRVENLKLDNWVLE